MANDVLLDRIHADRNVMMGKAVIKGTRLTVEFVIGLLAQGVSIDDILAEYDGLDRADIQACLVFAVKALDGPAVLPLA